MPYYRRSRSSYSRGRSTRRRYSAPRRRTRRTRSRRMASQRIVIQVVGGPAGGSSPLGISTLSKKGRRPLRAKY